MAGFSKGLNGDKTIDTTPAQNAYDFWAVIFRAPDGGAVAWKAKLMNNRDSGVLSGYPNWRQVVPNTQEQRTKVTLPEEHGFAAIVNGLPGADITNSPVDLMVENGAVSVKATTGGCILLEGATAKGPDIKIRLNRDYLTKAFAYGLTQIGLTDAMSPLLFTREGRQMVVMPLRIADIQEPTNQPAPQEPQPERKPMSNGHTNGATTPHLNGAQRSTTPVNPAADKPAIEVAIDKLDGFKVTFREALVGVTELTTLLRQAVRDQKAGEKEVQFTANMRFASVAGDFERSEKTSDRQREQGLSTGDCELPGVGRYKCLRSRRLCQSTMQDVQRPASD